MKLDLDELELRAAAAATATTQAWRVYRCCSAGPEEACGVKDEPFVSEDEDTYQRGVVFDTNRDECAHAMHGLIAEHIAANSPPVTLALIARIRELEAIALDALNGWQRHHECEIDFTDGEARVIEQQRAKLDNGAVLP